MSVLCLYYDMWKDKNLKNIYNKGVHFKSNPRTFEYMKDLAEEKLDNCEIINLKDPSELKNIDFDQYNEIVLLYPDSTGLGWQKIEAFMLNHVNEMKNIYMINGRRRKIVFNKVNLLSLRFRRFLERSLFGEILFTLFFIVVTPVLLIKDLINGKK